VLAELNTVETLLSSAGQQCSSNDWDGAYQSLEQVSAILDAMLVAAQPPVAEAEPIEIPLAAMAAAA
jgi:hypothetical protein